VSVAFGLERPIETVGLESGLLSTPDMSPHRTIGRYVPILLQKPKIEQPKKSRQS
jgi:hypothetical protein